MSSSSTIGYSHADERRSRLWQVTIFLGAIWAVALVNQDGELNRAYGLKPRDPDGLIGILAAPFLHGSFWHVGANTLTLGVILYQRAMAPWHELWMTVGFMSVATHSLIWLLHPPTGDVPLVGASGLACALVGHALACCVMFFDVIPLIIIGAQIWFFWDIYVTAFAPNDFGVSWIGHWIGIGVGVWVAVYRGTSF